MAFVSVVVALVGVLGAFLGLLPPLTGFGLYFLGMSLLPLVGVLLGLAGLWRTRRGVRDGRDRAWIGLGVSGALLLVFVLLGLPGAGVPPIHDITTSPDRPPSYHGPAAAERDLSYPHGGGNVAEQQRLGYPDLAPIELSVAANQGYSRALEAAREMGLEILLEDATGLRLEATDTTRLFRFVDDFVVEVEEAGAGSVAHVRSTSRVGQSDLGANAFRIRRFAEILAPGD